MTAASRCWQDRAVLFDCAGEFLLGIVSVPEATAETGVLVIVGGPQYRAGSQRLRKNGIPDISIEPKVKSSIAPDVHFYYISWPASNLPFSDGLGAVEVDARSGRVSFVALWSPEFYDLSQAGVISNRVYKPDSTPKRPPRPNPAERMPKPTTREIKALIPVWLDYCHRLGLDPGVQTNVASVDWIELLYPPMRIC